MRRLSEWLVRHRQVPRLEAAVKCMEQQVLDLRSDLDRLRTERDKQNADHASERATMFAMRAILVALVVSRHRGRVILDASSVEAHHDHDRFQLVTKIPEVKDGMERTVVVEIRNGTVDRGASPAKNDR